MYFIIGLKLFFVKIQIGLLNLKPLKNPKFNLIVAPVTTIDRVTKTGRIDNSQSEFDASLFDFNS